jgi:hypothetical protein
MNQHLDRLDGLALFLHAPALKLVELCDAKLKRKLMIVSGWRSVQEQMLNYQKGRTMNRETGEWEVSDVNLIVTKAKPGFTPHNAITRDGQRAALAFDCVPLKPNGDADWLVDMGFWDNLYELSWKVGLDPLGDPLGEYLKGDLGHFQEPGWKYKSDGMGIILPVSGLVTI